MEALIKWMDDLPKILKIVFALPFLDFIWNIYRLCKSLQKKNIIGIVLSIVLLIFGLFFLWIVDIITIVLQDKVYWID